MADAVTMDNRKAAVAARLARFAAAMNSPVESCPYRGDDAESAALRRVWLSAFLRLRPPAGGAVSYDGDGVAAAAGDDLEGDPADDEAEAEQHQQDWEAAVAALLVVVPVMLAPIVDDLTGQVRDRLSAGNVAALAGLVVGGVVVSTLAGALLDAMNPLSLSSAAAVAAAAARQGVNVRAPKNAGVQRNRQVAKVTARLVVTGLAQSATRTALAAAGPDTDADTVARQVNAHLGTLTSAPSGWVADQFSAALSAAQNSGRAAVFEKAPPKLIRAVEINDKARCGPCAEVDGTTFPTVEAALAAYPTGGYAHCAGGLRCRGFLAAEW